MLRRYYSRIPVEFEAEIISSGRRYKGVVENLSEDGIYVRTVPVKTTIDFTSGKTLEVEFQFPSGETLNLPCKVEWSNKTSSNGLTYNLGLVFIEKSLTYEELFKTLYAHHMEIL